MIISYLRFAVRNIVRHKIFSAINVFGLAISITAFILMALYVEFEVSYDNFNVNASRIYRVADDKQTPDVTLRSAASAAPIAPALQADFPEVQQAVRMIDNEALISYNNKLFEERRIFFADESIFHIFSFNLLKGNADNALKDPMSIVLTTSMAAKYFGSTDPLGKVISVDKKNMKVTGVMQDVPANSHLSFDFLLSMSTAKQEGSGYDWLFTNWYSNNFYTYILLPENYNPARLSSKFEDFDHRHREAGTNTRHHYALENLRDIYLHSNRDDQLGATGNVTNVYIFSIVALFILLIACINFINLSTATASARAKEVAVKKVIGADRHQMIIQFFIESFLMTTIAFAVAIALSALLLPAFNIFSGQSVVLHIFSPLHIVVILSLLFFVGFLSGFYPAIVLSGFQPITALKGKFHTSAGSISVRKGLVVFQFTVSIVLIICTAVVFMQLQYMQQHDLGFNRSQTIVINFEGDNQVQQQYKTIRQQLLRIPGIQNVTASSAVPGDGRTGGWSMDFAKKTGDTLHTELPIYLVDYNYLSQYHIPMVAGRAFSEEYPADASESMIINESAVKKLGFQTPADAIGTKVGMYPQDAKIIGVFKDFHYESLQKTIAPLTMRIFPNKLRLLSIEVNTGNIQQTIASIERTWKLLAPQRPLEYSFLDETFNKQYKAEIKFKQIFTVGASLAIIIACLGLFGLALFSVQQRTKEIGIRKVLGASVLNIVAMLSKNFIGLVIISIVVAAPVAWYFMGRWLQNFAYKTTINWWLLLLAALSSIVIALLTVGIRAIQAAIANPVKSLRAE